MSLTEQIEKLKDEGFDVIIEECSDSSIKRSRFDALIQRFSSDDSFRVTKWNRVTRYTFQGSVLINNVSV